MALKAQYTRPISTQVTRLRIGPNRVDKDRSALAMTSPYPGNTSTNAGNANVSMVDQVLTGTYQPTTAPTQATGITTHSLYLWNITTQETAHAPDIIPGDVLTFLSQDNIPGAGNSGTPAVDALTNSGLLVLGVYVSGSSPYDLNLLLYNSTGGTLSTPASYNPTILIERFRNHSTDPNVIY